MKFFQGPNDVVYAVHTKEMASQMATRGYKLVSVVALPNDPQTLPPCVEMVTRGGRGAGPSEPDPMSLPMPPKPFIPKIGRRASDPPVAAQILGHFEDKVVIKNDGGVETAYRPMKGWDAESRSAAKFTPSSLCAAKCTSGCAGTTRGMTPPPAHCHTTTYATQKVRRPEL